MLSADADLLQRLLDSSSVTAWISRFRHPSINRRQFLVGSSATIPSLAATPLLAATGPSISGTTVVTVTFQGSSWIIDPRSFAPAGAGKPKVSWRSEPTISADSPRYYIELTNARFPGTSIRADFQAEVYDRDQIWHISLRFHAFSKFQEVDLADWVARSPNGKISGPVGSQQIDIGSSGCSVILPSQGGELLVGADFRFQFSETINPLSLQLGTYKSVVDRIVFQIATASPIGSVFAGLAPTQPVTFVEIQCIAPHENEIHVGKFSANNDVSLLPISLGLSGDCYEDGAQRNAAVVIDGCGAVRIAPWKSQFPPIYIQVERFCLAGLTKTFGKAAVLGAKIARATFGVEVGPFALEIQGQSAETTLLRIQDGRVPPFSANVELMRAHVPVRGASSAEVDFPALALQIAFDAPGEPPAKPPDKVRDEINALLESAELPCDCAEPPAPPQTSKWHADAETCRGASLSVGPQPSVLLPLEFAHLHLRRSADLFNISFRFQHYEMRVDEGTTALRRRWAVPENCHMHAPDARLIVQFPPQHIFEEAAGYQSEWGPKSNTCLPIDPPKPGRFPPPTCTYNIPTLPPATPAPARTTRAPPFPTAARHPAPNPPPAPAMPPLMSGNCREDSLLRPVYEMDIAMTRISGPTRIAFSVTDPTPVSSQPPPPPPRRPIPSFKYKDEFAELTIEDLTDWRDLALVVHRRALPADAALKDQLAVVRPEDAVDDFGITTGTTRSHAGTKIQASLTGPNHWQTAIEAPFRLLVSPDSSAKFDTPRTVPDPVAPQLWHSELVQNSKTGVRAVYARCFDSSYLNPPRSRTLDNDNLNFVGAMAPLDRREIVGLTSVYGVPGLRRLQQDQSGQIFDDPRGMVVRPDHTYAMLDIPTQLKAPDGTKVYTGQEGFIIAKAFERFDLMLTSVGATLSAKWIGEPPAAFQPPVISADMFQFFSPSYTIEKYSHRTTFGRDIHVELNYKGFLFPLGHRAALVKVSERMFLPQRLNGDFLRPTAYLAQRKFIVLKKPRKSFPTFGQDFDGRDLYCDAVEILTTPTPDLTPNIRTVDFSVTAPSSVNGTPGKALPAPLPSSTEDTCKRNEPTVGMVFWPRTKPGTLLKTISFDTSQGSRYASDTYGNEVVFEYTVQDNKPAASSPLLFVDNAAAHDPTTMEYVVKYYRNIGAAVDQQQEGARKSLARFNPASASSADLSYLRLAEHANTSRIYAPAKKDGETSYQTRTWTLSARGRIATPPSSGPNAAISPNVETENFTMDAFMEGADQPPFYPWIERAQVTMQSLDRLLGHTQGLIDVAFPANYVRYGFDSAHNPSEIYLDVISPQIHLDVTSQGQGDAVGGVAQTNAMLANISRKVGFVGGVPLPKPRDQKARAAAPPSLSPPPGSTAPVGNLAPPAFDNSSAVAGRFDPMEFFGGALKDAKLLGVVSLKDILRTALMAAAPILAETVVYGATGDDVAKAITSALKVLAPDIRDATTIVLNKAQTALDAINRQLSAGSSNPPLQLGDIYPDVYKALVQLQATSTTIAQSIDDSLTGLQLAMALQYASELLAMSRNLLATIEQLARNPIPAVITNTLLAIQQAWAEIQKLFKDSSFKEFIAALSGLIAGGGTSSSYLAHVCTDLINNNVFPAVLGPISYDFGPSANPPTAPPWDQLSPPTPPDPPTIDQICQRILTNPEDVLAKVQESLFYEVFSGPLYSAINAVNRFQGQLNGKIAWSRQIIAERIVGILKSITADVSHYRLSALAWTIVAELESITNFDVTSVSNPLAEIQRRAGIAQTDIAASIMAALADFQADLDSQIKAINGENGSIVTLQRAIAGAALESVVKSDMDKIAKLQGSLNQLLQLQATYNQIKNNGAQTVAAQVLDVGQRQIQQGLREFQDEANQLAKNGVSGMAERVMQQIDGFFDAGMRSAEFGAVAQISRAATDWANRWCGAGDPGDDPTKWNVVQTIQNISVNVLSTATGFAGAAQGLLDKLNAAEIPPQLPAELVVRVQQAKSSLTQSLQRVMTLTAELVRARNTVGGFAVSKGCAQLADLLNITSHVMELRRKAVKSVRDVLEDSTRMIDAIDVLLGSQQRLRTNIGAGAFEATSAVVYATESAPPDSWAAITQSIGQIAADIANILMSVTSINAVTKGELAWTSVKAKAQQLATTIGPGKLSANDLTKSVAALEAAAAGLAGSIATDVNTLTAVSTNAQKRAAIESLKTIAHEVMDYAVKHDRHLAALILQASNVSTALENDLVDVGLTVVRNAAHLLLEPYGVVSKAFGDIAGLLTPDTGPNQKGDDALITLLTGPLLTKLAQAKAAVDNDVPDLTSLSTPTTTDPVNAAIRTAQGLRDRWTTQGIGLILAARIMGDLFNRVMSGHFDAIFNFDVLVPVLRDALAQIVPAKINLSYDFNSELGDYPPGDPIFTMDREAIADGDHEEPANDLVISAQVNIDLINPSNRTVTVTGSIRPFKIRLLGDRFDILTIYFSGAHFEKQPGGQAQFRADVSSLAIGEELSFLSALSGLFGSSDDNGPYIQPYFSPPGIKVGYRFHEDIIPMGDFELIDFGIEVSALLPFDDRSAEFRFALASRDRPFLISMVPFGGGGFVALNATAQGIVSFELSMEFGAVIAVEFGPLFAEGRVTAGFYLMSTQGGARELDGYVHAVGEGNIACFSITVNIEVATYESGSRMGGSSTYEITVKVGPFHVSYGFTATYGYQGGGGGGTHTADAIPALAKLAPISVVPGCQPSSAIQACITRNMPKKSTEWNEYQKFVALGLPTR